MAAEKVYGFNEMRLLVWNETVLAVERQAFLGAPEANRPLASLIGRLIKCAEEGVKAPSMSRYITFRSLLLDFLFLFLVANMY